METINVTKKGYLSIAESDDIVLRETATTKLVFKPTLVDDFDAQKKGVRGLLILCKKGQKEDWEIHKDLDLNKLKVGEWGRIELKIEEVERLFEGLQKNGMIVKEYGIETSGYSFYEKDEKFKRVIKILEDSDDIITELIDSDQSEVIEKVLKWIAKNDDANEVVDKLDSLEVASLAKINGFVGLTNLKKVMEIWETNKDKEQSEKFWQGILKEYSWILSQVLATPAVFIENEVYVGGKSFSNKGGRVIDFLYANPHSKNAVLIEIKTPQEKLISNSEYRSGLYTVSDGIVGAVTQVLKYRTSLQQTYRTTVQDSDLKDDEYFEAINPNCVVIAGKHSSLKTKDERQSFGFYRDELKTVTLLTFDELFARVQSFIDIIEDK